MKALALKLAALSAGTAAAATTATAKAAASTTAGGATAASAGTFSMAKVALSVALFGATVTGAMVWQGKVAVRQGASAPATQQTPSMQTSEVQPAAQRLELAPTAQNKATSPAAALEAAPSVPSDAPALRGTAANNTAESAVSEVRGSSSKARVTSRADEAPSASRTVSVSARVSSNRVRPNAVHAPAARTASTVNVTAAKSTEVELLRSARAALASRPREAFAITQEHREQYPRGVFAQERDALAVEALMRVGEMSTARTLAERFVREHPSSPHAHRFRETMDLR